jgi:SAM-dependent methyltransferase
MLEDFVPGNSNAVSIMKVNGLVSEDITGKVVLLAGTGSGMDIEWLLSLNPGRLICLDYSSHIETISRRYSDVLNVNFLIADVCDLPFSTGVFDLIISFGIIQHTRSPELAFSRQIKSLKPAGKMSIANLYSDNLLNHRISLCRHKYRIHEMDRDAARRIIKQKTIMYYCMVLTGTWRICKRVLLPFMLQFNNIPGKSFSYYYVNAEDYYMSAYRHQTSANEVKYWCDVLGVNYLRTSKGYQISV